MARKKTAIEYTLAYHIPLTDIGWPKRHNVAYRTETHLVTNPAPIRNTYESDPALPVLKQSYRNDGWMVTETDTGFRCECDGYVNEYADIRIVKY